jgi:hypothetical protein
MFEFIPEPLRERLGEEEARRLGEIILIVERALRQVYEMDARAYDPTVGDNLQLFGLGIWHHGWFAIEEALDGVDGVVVSHEDNSHRIHLGKLTLAVYKGGDYESETIYDVDLNGSATKRDYVARNQLQLFSFDEIERSIPTLAYELNTLWIVHFGNPRDELVKLYLGAPSRDADDRKEWAWYERVDRGGNGGGGGERIPEMPPSFDEQPEPEIALELEEDVGEAGGADGE